MKESRLSQTLLGFMSSSSDGGTLKGTDGDNNDNNKTATASALSAVSLSSSSLHISPMLIVETFLEKLTYINDDDGQVVVDKGIIASNCSIATTTMTTGGGNNNKTHNGYKREPSLKFCVLNPAVQAKDLLCSTPRAVAMVGGMLQPLDVIMRELIPGPIADHAAITQLMWRSTPSSSGGRRNENEDYKSGCGVGNKAAMTNATNIILNNEVRSQSSSPFLLSQQREGQQQQRQQQQIRQHAERKPIIAPSSGKDNIVIQNPYSEEKYRRQ